MFTIITIYREILSDALTIKRETCDYGKAAKEAFSIYIMDPDCAACMVIDNSEGGKYVLRYDEERFE